MGSSPLLLSGSTAGGTDSNLPDSTAGGTDSSLPGSTAAWMGSSLPGSTAAWMGSSLPGSTAAGTDDISGSRADGTESSILASAAHLPPALPPPNQ